MKLRLHREPQTRPGLEWQWRALDVIDAEPRALRRDQLLAKDRRQRVGVTVRLGLGCPQIAIDAAELAVDRERTCRLFDRIDRCRVTLGAESRARAPEMAFEREEPIVERRGEVRARARRLATADRTLIDHEHVDALLDER